MRGGGIIRKYIHFMRKNKYIKVIMDVVFFFVYEFFTNKIVSNIPCSRFRNLYYKYIINVRISSSAYLQMGCYLYPEFASLEIGNNTIINQDVILDRRAGLYIGDNVNISREVAIYTGGHKIDSSNFAYYGEKVVINDHVWVGTRAMIMPGVTIGEGAVILPGAIVTHDCEPYTVYAGIPAKKIRMRNKDLNYELTWRSYFL